MDWIELAAFSLLVLVIILKLALLVLLCYPSNSHGGKFSSHLGLLEMPLLPPHLPRGRGGFQASNFTLSAFRSLPEGLNTAGLFRRFLVFPSHSVPLITQLEHISKSIKGFLSGSKYNG